jgi:hypothetical protein
MLTLATSFTTHAIFSLEFSNKWRNTVVLPVPRYPDSLLLFCGVNFGVRETKSGEGGFAPYFGGLGCPLSSDQMKKEQGQRRTW